ncbi:MAG: hypothetical protein HRT88_23665, partial [Lentisphaeraceae bacterium]|nr:hypothetical protein [Lentisphaeraceae bacterium]
MNRLLITLIVGLCCATSLNAGNVFLTGHDVNLHGGQSGYDEIILNYLRDDIAIGAYSVGYLTRGGTSAGLTSIQAAGYGVTTADVTGFADGTAFDAFLAGIDILVVPWVVDIGVAGSNALNGFSGNIETFFNAGGDIWANSAHTTATYYDFLPPGAAGSGPSISG